MKKRIACFLSILLLVSCFAPAAAALTKEDVADDPVIIVPGYAASALFRYYDDGSKEQVWGWNIMADLLLNEVKKIAPELLAGVGMMTLGQAKLLGKTLGRAVEDLTAQIACTPDGESLYDVRTLPNDPDACRWDHLKHVYGEYYAEAAVGNELRDYVEDENLFNFFMDFRMGALENAAELDRFIEAVKAYTGKDKVDLYAISHGGQVTATYLSLYGDKKSVDNAVLVSPAIGGAGFAFDFFNGSMKLDEEMLVRFIECAVCSEYDFEWLVKAQQLGFLDDILAGMLPSAYRAGLGWQSLWDFIPMDEFDAYIETAAPRGYDGIKEKTTRFHRDVMAHMGESLRRCRENGIDVNVVAGTGNPIVTGYRKNSDGIITAAASTGAVCAPLGQRFANGYACCGTVCADPAHNHLSPSMEVDASAAYLPENTWFIDGMFHGFITNEPYTKALAFTLLFTDQIADVRADPAFPQFKASGNKAYSVSGSFNASPDGYLSAADTAFTVTNLSDDLRVKIIAVQAAGADLAFSGDYKTWLAPHESAVFTVSGKLPETSAARAAVTVTYLTEKSVSPLGERTLDFTLTNGEPVAYDAANPYCAADFTPPIDTRLPDGVSGLLKKIGWFDLLSLFYNIFQKLLANFKAALPIA